MHSRNKVSVVDELDLSAALKMDCAFVKLQVAWS